MAFKFEELRVWELAINQSAEVSKLVKSFPGEEKFALSSQIQRAADSVALNIAEDSTGQSNAEFKKFLGANASGRHRHRHYRRSPHRLADAG